MVLLIQFSVVLYVNKLFFFVKRSVRLNILPYIELCKKNFF